MDLDLNDIKLDFKEGESIENKVPLLSEEEEKRIIRDRDYSLSLDEDDYDEFCLEDVFEVLEINDEDEYIENESSDCEAQKSTAQDYEVKENTVEEQKQRFTLENNTTKKNFVVELSDGKENKNQNKFDLCLKYEREIVKDKRKRQNINLEEFFVELLTDHAYGSFIHWTYKERKEFNLGNPRQIANAWGKIKNKRKFTPENLTREIRKLRKAGRLKKLERKDHYQFIE